MARRRGRRRGRRFLRRDTRGRFLPRGRRVRRIRRRRNVWRGHAAGHAEAARKGWHRRGKGGRYVKGYARFSGAHYARNPKRRRRRNPFALGGRRGRFELIPSMNTLKGAAVRGAGAVGSEVVRASAYSLMGRDLRNTSVLEDTVGRLVSGALTGMLAGYLGGASMASQVVEGAYTVAMYELVADAVALATGGRTKILGFVANPFANRAVKALIPGFGGATAPAALPAAETMEGLMGVVPEGAVLPLGAVEPEGAVVPLGETGRFVSRF